MTNTTLQRLWPSAYASGLIKIIGKPATEGQMHHKGRLPRARKATLKK